MKFSTERKKGVTILWHLLEDLQTVDIEAGDAETYKATYLSSSTPSQVQQAAAPYALSQYCSQQHQQRYTNQSLCNKAWKDSTFCWSRTAMVTAAHIRFYSSN